MKEKSWFLLVDARDSNTTDLTKQEKKTEKLKLNSKNENIVAVV